jgi:hypothetical protein
MQIQTIVEDVKARAEKVSKEAQARYETVSKQAQGVLNTSKGAAKKAADLVKKNAKKVADTNQGVAKNLVEGAKISFSKAREAGLKEVVAKPAEFLPEGKDQVVKAYNDTLSTLSQTRDGLQKLLKKSAEQIKVTVAGKPVVKAAAKKAPAARKPAAKKAAPAATATKTNSAAPQA